MRAGLLELLYENMTYRNYQNRSISSLNIAGICVVYIAKSVINEQYVCSEFLVHAADVEGLCQGIDEQLVESKHH